MNVIVRIARWILVLPVSFAALVIVYALTKIFDYIGSEITNFFIGPPGDSTIFCGLIAGCAFVFAGVKTAPAGRKYVAVVLAALPILGLVATIVVSFIYVFYDSRAPNFPTIWRNIGFAVGAVGTAWEMYRKNVSSTLPTPLMPLAEGPEDHEAPLIDYDALAREYDDDEEAPL